MYSEDDLNAAVKAGVMADATARAFRDFVAARQAAPAVDEEHFRLVTGFNDIFVTIAAGLLLVALSQAGAMLSPAGGAAAVAAASWGLAEYFTRQRRMALPSIMLLFGFVGGVFYSLTNLATQWLSSGQAFTPGAIAAAAALAAAAAGLHWLRFKVPVTIAALVGSAIAALVALAMALRPESGGDWWLGMVFLGGLATFALAMRWDASDRTRTTRRADVAFWLHLTAAPMIVHPAFALLGRGGDTMLHAAMAVAMYLVLALVALAIDRRALLVSALFYVLYAITAVLKDTGSLDQAFTFTALVIASALLLLSALWHKVRGGVLALVPGPLERFLPPAG